MRVLLTLVLVLGMGGAAWLVLWVTDWLFGVNGQDGVRKRHV